MIGAQQKFDEVVQAVDGWIPKKEYNHERKFQDELQDYLDERLNSGGGGIMAAESKDDVVEKEHGSSKADIAVNDNIGVEMKRELSNSQTKKLRGQIENYLDNYNFVIVCACGIDDMSGWRKLKNKYEGHQGGISQQEVVFMHKKKENYGKEPSQVGGSGGEDLGGSLF